MTGHAHGRRTRSKIRWRRKGFCEACEVLESRTLLATVPQGFADAHVAGSLTSPTAMALAPDGRIFVAQQNGQVRVIKNGQLLSTPFATVTTNTSNERGLLGITLDPNFAGNQYVYVYYTATQPILHNRISRFTASGDVARAVTPAATRHTSGGAALARTASD